MAAGQALVPIAALSFPVAIVLASTDKEARGIARVALLAATAIAVITATLAWILAPAVLAPQLEESALVYALLLGVLVWGNGHLQIVQNWLIRERLFKVTARVAVVQAIILGMVRTGGGLVYPASIVLIVAATFGPVLQGTMLRLASRPRLRTFGWDPAYYRSQSLVEIAKTHWEFPIYRAPQALLNAVSQSVPVIILTAFFGVKPAAFYALSKLALGAPLQLIGRAVNDAFYPRVVAKQRVGKGLRKYLISATSGLAGLGIVPFLAVIGFGPYVFEFVFGSEWVTAGHYAQWLAVWYFGAFLNRPSVAAIPALNLQRSFLLYEVISFGCKVGALFLGLYITRDAIGTVAIFSIVGAMLNLSLVACVVRRAG